MGVNCENFLNYQILINHGIYIFIYGTIIATLVCIVVFTAIVSNNSTTTASNNKGQMFNYFLVKSISDLIMYLSLIPEYLYIKDTYGSKSYLWQIWYIWFYRYIYNTSISFSNYMEIAAAIDCYLMIKNKLKFLITKRTFYIVLVSSLLINMSMNVYYIFRYEIISDVYLVNQTSIQLYKIESSNFSMTTYSKAIHYISMIHREIIPLIILSVMNVFILLLLKVAAARKKQTQRTSQRYIGTAIYNAQINKIKMILIISFSYIILRLPQAYYVLKPRNSIFWNCFYFSISVRMYDSSFLIQFFNYYFFNKTFKKFFYKVFKFRINCND
jgi:hypothetical protein